MPDRPIMMTRRHTKRLIAPRALAVLTLLGVSMGGPDVHGDQHDHARRLRESGEIQPLEEIIAKARQQHPGHLIETELEEIFGRYVYEIELVDDHGVVWELKYDAVTGELIGREQEEHGH